MRGQLLILLLCAGAFLLLVLMAWVLFFRLSCRLCKLPPPSLLRSIGIVVLTFVIASIGEGILAAGVRGAYRGFGWPRWETGFVTFFLGLPVDMVVNAGVHAGMMKLPFGKGIEVWFVQRVLLFSVILLAGGLAAIAFLAGEAGR
jgi:hypothetical protein